MSTICAVSFYVFGSISEVIQSSRKKQLITMAKLTGTVDTIFFLF